ncbi:phosphotransferase family protein [Nodosilinea sp. AN01ver1]|uniref:phosphotransferase family protein n=1 Tax=Nodosilinea sp. AN01ver1 TaxID=3423362 RepID=UPI003D318A1C
MLDPKIPFLENALDPEKAQIQLQAVVPKLHRVTRATLMRHRAGRRALIEYHLDTATGPTTLLGKIRAKGTDRASYQIQQDLWNTGWDAHSRDCLCVPQPLGLLPDWHMVLQRKVPGTPATQLLPTPAGIRLAQRIAELAHKLHRTPVSTAKTHNLANELSILRDRLPLVVEQHPHWATRIHDILAACHTLANSIYPLTPLPPHLLTHLPPFSLWETLARWQSLSKGQTTSLRDRYPSTPQTTIHRDFYADQILVDAENPDGQRLWLVDLDLCCQGSPAVDVGNFIAHITEQSLRERGDVGALSDRETRLKMAYLNLTCRPGQDSEAINALKQEIELYTVLTLVRHLHISTRIPSRRPFTEQLLCLCENRLDKTLNGA